VLLGQKFTRDQATRDAAERKREAERNAIRQMRREQVSPVLDLLDLLLAHHGASGVHRGLKRWAASQGHDDAEGFADSIIRQGTIQETAQVWPKSSVAISQLPEHLEPALREAINLAGQIEVPDSVAKAKRLIREIRRDLNEYASGRDLD
jgi:hypothetical protein